MRVLLAQDVFSRGALSALSLGVPTLRSCLSDAIAMDAHDFKLSIFASLAGQWIYG